MPRLPKPRGRSCLAAVVLPVLLAACGGDNVAATGAPERPSFDCSTVVQVESGRLQGVAETQETCRYLGVPFAAPPEGELRWRPPQPAPAWHGVRVADRYGPQCPQEAAVLDLGATPWWGQDDCLYLNVWRPSYEPTDPLPVMVFFHGGAFTIGAGSWPQYEGTYLAMHDVVVVTVNYRLGPFGYLALPELAAEDQDNDALDGSYGNYGLLDQVAALEWVRANAPAFSGDPANVTIFGESAGAMSVCSLMASPLANGRGAGPALFHRAIIESGGCTAVGTPERSFAQGASYVADADCDAAPEPLACLRALNVDELMSRTTVDTIADGYHPHVDGVVLPTVPLVALQTGQGARVPLIAGSNLDEVKPAVVHPPTLDYIDRPWSEFWDRVGEIYGPGEVPALRRLYPQRDYANPVEVWAALQSDALLHCPTQIAAAVHARSEPTFHYSFAWDDMPLGEHFGAFHAWELPFVFGVLWAWNPIYGPDDRTVRALSQRVQRYWTHFARTGDPNDTSGADPLWRGYEDRHTLVIDVPMGEATNLRQARCDYWEPRIPVGLDLQTENTVALGGD